MKISFKKRKWRDFTDEETVKIMSVISIIVFSAMVIALFIKEILK
jgi:hypothetical protein